MNTEFKDKDPIETVEFIKNIFKKKNIKITETALEERPGGIYSVHLAMPSIGLTTNGKGMSKDLCYASAYGEMIERYSDYLEYCGDLKSLESQMKKFNELSKYAIDNFSDIKKDIYGEFYLKFRKKENFNLNDFCSYLVGYYVNNRVNLNLTEFFDVRNNKNVKLPYMVLKSLTGTNGLSSGNSKEEALIEGISELLERYCENQIRYGFMTPPEIPDSYIEEKAPECLKIIKLLDEEYDIKSKVVDLSLGKGLPVVGIIYIYKDSPYYYFQTGAHPVFRIALERCLTEFYQCDITNKRVKVSYDVEKNLRTHKNFRSMENKVTPMSLKIFDLKKSYTFKDWDISEGFNNVKGLQHLFDIVLKIADTIYIGDISHTEQPAFYTYIPGISPVVGYYPCFDNLVSDLFLAKIPICCDTCSDLTQLDKDFILKHRDDLIASTVLDPAYVLASLFVEREDYLNAIKELGKVEKNDEDNSFLQATILDLELRALDKPEEERNIIISEFFTNSDDIIENELDAIWRKSNTFQSLVTVFHNEEN